MKVVSFQEQIWNIATHSSLYITFSSHHQDIGDFLSVAIEKYAWILDEIIDEK